MADEKKKNAEDEKDIEKKGEGDGEANPEAAAADDEATAKAAKKKKLILIGGAGAVVLLIVIGAAAFLLGGKSGEEGGNPAVAVDTAGKPAYYALGDMIVNLSGEGKRPNYLKVKITLELADEKDASLMDMIKPRIVDNFQVYLRELRLEDLRGSAGMYRLREELLMRVTEAAQPVRVRDVLFQEMLVQ